MIIAMIIDDYCKDLWYPVIEVSVNQVVILHQYMSHIYF